MRKLINILMIALIFTLTSCARGCQTLKRSTIDNSEQWIRIKQYSGGKLINTFEFNGIVTDPSGSDGYQFYYEGNLVEVSGDVTIEYLGDKEPYKVIKNPYLDTLRSN